MGGGGGGGLQGFVEGGMASVAAGCATHPLDLIKVRMQLQVSHQPAFSTTTTHSAFALQPQPSQPLPSPLHPSQPFTPSSSHGPLSMATRIIRTEGAPALFSGISATILRQTLYSSTRLGIYEALTASTPSSSSSSSNNNNNNPLPHTGETMKLMKKIGAGIIAGGVGAAIGNPADVALVRMQADGRLPIHLRRNYAGVGDALFTIVKQEGLHTLWRGSSLTIHRAMVVTAAQLTTYDEAKEQLLRRSGMKDGVPIHVAASFLAGLVASAASNPIDVIKTRIMSMKRECGPGSMSCGALDCAIKTMKLEGFMSLYKGFTPTVMRQGPYTVVLFVTLEQIRKLFGQPSS